MTRKYFCNKAFKNKIKRWRMRIWEQFRGRSDRCWIPGNNRHYPRRPQHLHNRFELPRFPRLSRTRWWLQNCWWCHSAGQFYSLGCAFARQNLQRLGWPVRWFNSLRALGRHCRALLPRHSSKINIFRSLIYFNFRKSPVNSASTTNSSTTTQTSSLSQPTTSLSTPNTTTLVMTAREWTTTFACSSSKKIFWQPPRTVIPSSPSVCQLKTSLTVMPAGLPAGEPLPTEVTELSSFNLSASVSWTTTTAWTSHIALTHKKVIIAG